MSQPRYQAFISYSHRDAGWAAWLHRALETYRVPKLLVGSAGAHGSVPARLAPVFRDREELASASDLGREISAALADSANLIVICSPHAAASRWVNEEVLAFKRLGRAERIFCLIVDGEPNASDLPGRAAEECFCPALRFALDDDGAPARRRCEPIAADARPHGDGRANAKLKLIAGLLGVGLDALRQREHHRQQRRMLAITAVALLVMGVTSALAVAAFVARDAAERRQKQAEELVGFMLGDLTSKLNEVNRLDILAGVAEKSLDYFQTLSPAEVTADAKVGWAKALLHIGRVKADRGFGNDALAAYQAAENLLAGLDHSVKQDSAAVAAEAANFVGVILWKLNRIDEAEAAFSRAGRTLSAAIAASPQSIDLLKQSAYMNTNRSRLLEVRGLRDQAKRRYREVLDTFVKLAQLDTGNRAWKTEIGYAHNNLGKLALETGDLAEAKRHFQLDYDIKDALSREDPADHGMLDSLALSRLFLAKALNSLGSTDEAIRQVHAAGEAYRFLIDFDNENLGTVAKLAVAERTCARFNMELGHHLQALADARSAVRHGRRLVETDPGNAAWALALSESLLVAAEASRSSGNASEAVRLLQESGRLLQSVSTEAVNLRTFHRLMLVQQIASSEWVDAGQAGEARTGLRQQRSAAAEFIESGDPDWIELSVRLSLVLGERDGLATRLTRLAETGYARPGFVRLMADAGIDYSPVRLEPLAAVRP